MGGVLRCGSLSMRTTNSCMCPPGAGKHSGSGKRLKYRAQSPVTVLPQTQLGIYHGEQCDPAAKSGAGEEVGTADQPGMSSPLGLELTEAHLSAIADKVVERLTAGKATPDGQGEEVIRLFSWAAPSGGGVYQTCKSGGKPQWVAKPACTGQA